MNQNLSLYRIFYTTALAGNISRAAEELFISQPAVSKSIQKLEQSLNVSLFTRSSRGVQLTEEGELLLSHVKSAFQTLENAEHELRLRREFGMEQLRIGVSSTLCKYVLLPSLKDFVRLHPHLRVTISCQSTRHTLEMLEAGELDLGLTGQPKELPGLTFSPLMEIQDTFVAAKDYLSTLKSLLSKDDTAAFLKQGVLLLLDKDNLTRQYLDRHLKEQGLFPESILEISSMDLLIDFARTGLGIAGVIREFVQKELLEGTLLELPLPFFIAPRKIGFVYRKGTDELDMIHALTEAVLLHRNALC